MRLTHPALPNDRRPLHPTVRILTPWLRRFPCPDRLREIHPDFTWLSGDGGTLREEARVADLFRAALTTQEHPRDT